MKNYFTVSCQCGSFKAQADVASSKGLSHIVCYCEDCQAYIRHLEKSAQVLDDHGGTDIIQMSPACLHIKNGQQNLGIVRLTDRGIFRWYATCCNTPLYNTPPSANMPFLGLLKHAVTDSATAVRQLAGPVSVGVCAGAQYPFNADWPVKKGFGLAVMFGALRNIVRWRTAGDHKKSELFDLTTGHAIVKPQVLTTEQRAALSTNT